MTPVDDACRLVVERARALPPSIAVHHVMASVDELQHACSERHGVRGAVERVVSSVRQLQADLADGPRRREMHDAQAVERLLETLQEELLPELRRSDLL